MLLTLLLGVFEAVFAVIEGVFGLVAGAFAVIRVQLFQPYSYLNWLKRDLKDCDSILELGCGSYSPILKIGYGQKTDTVDIFQPYVDRHNQNKDYRLCQQADILTLPFAEKKYDAVVMFDVLEHLPREKVNQIRLFEQMEKCAKKKVIFFTPNGFIENDLVDEDPYQEHVSAWQPEDYQKRGYLVRGATGLRAILGKASLPKYRPYSIFRIVAMLSQPVIFKYPKLAWHSYAVKELNNG